MVHICQSCAVPNLERVWNSTNSEEAHVAWNGSLKTY